MLSGYPDTALPIWPHTGLQGGYDQCGSPCEMNTWSKPLYPTPQFCSADRQTFQLPCWVFLKNLNAFGGPSRYLSKQLSGSEAV